MNTERFRMGTGAYFTRLVYLHGTRPIVIVATLFLVAFILAFALDIRFAIVAVMIAFIIVPLAMAWLYFFHGLLPGYAFNISWHILSVSPEGIEVILFRPVYSRESDKESDEDTERIVRWEMGKRLFFPKEEIGGILTGGDGVTVPLKGGMIAIPRDAFKNQEDYEKFVKGLQ